MPPKKKYECKFLDRYKDPEQNGYSCLEVFSYINGAGVKIIDDRYAVCRTCRMVGKPESVYKFGVTHGGLSDCKRHITCDTHKNAARGVNDGLYGGGMGMAVFPTFSELNATR